jgi:hypothetical protein
MRHDFKVIINKVIGETAENETQCNICGRVGTVVILGREQVCKVCLMVADTAINRAICPPCARLEGTDVSS